MVLSSKIGTCCGLCEKCAHVLEDPSLDVDYCRKSNTLQKLVRIELLLANMIDNSKAETIDVKSYVISEGDSDTELEKEVETT